MDAGCGGEAERVGGGIGAWQEMTWGISAASIDHQIKRMRSSS